MNHSQFITSNCFFCGDSKPLGGPISTVYTEEQRKEPDRKGHGIYWFYLCEIPNIARICSVCRDFNNKICGGKKKFEYKTIITGNDKKGIKSKLPNIHFIDNWNVSLTFLNNSLIIKQNFYA